MRRLLSPLLVPLVPVAACSSDSNGPQQGNGSITATINGSSWTATVGASAQRLTNGGTTIISVGGANSQGTTLAFAFPDNGVATYTIGGATDISDAIFTDPHNSASWLAAATQGSGTIYVTALTSARVAGTFNFIAPATSGTGASGTKTVTNGHFDVSF